MSEPLSGPLKVMGTDGGPVIHPCSLWLPNVFDGPTPRPEEMLLSFWTTTIDLDEGFFVRMYERGLRLRGWDPVQGSAHLHITQPDLQRLRLVHVHGLALRAAEQEPTDV